MPKQPLPIYQIQDFNAQAQKERYFYVNSFANHLQEHLFTREPHKHDFYIVILITKGSGTHTIDFKKYEVRPNTIFFMKPGQVHSWEISEDADGMVVFFTSEFYLKEFPYRKLYDFPFFNALLYQPKLTVSEAGKMLILQVYEALQKEYAVPVFMRNEMLRSYLNIMFINLARMYHAQGFKGEMAGKELVLLQHLEDLIEQHFKEHAPVTFYAGHLNVTTKHLNEVCKRSVGKTTNELLQERLLLEAQRLLVHSELTSSQIATELGYFDTTYFFRFFKKHVGQTPEQFRSAGK
ncbi:helix-turn-helix domain-containing protein [Adhaeribacter terreus]|uniref:Helix-turn-helix domain-containing protein n=1 Tax=Adhaeribacter terreus TaxID=529703 RepID=A0ABW0E975_9BACT